MSYTVHYHPDVLTYDLPRINRNIHQRIRKAIEARLMVSPVLYGEPLRRALKGYRKLRVGDYRVIYEVCGEEIRVYAIGHRKEVYERIDQRL